MTADYSSGQLLKSRLAGRLAIYTVIFSLTVALAGTAIQFYIAYRDVRQDVTAAMNRIKHSHLPALVESLWTFDDQMIRTNLEQICTHAHVNYLLAELKGRGRIEHGRKPSGESVTRTFDLLQTHRDQTISLGRLTVVSDLDEVYRHLVFGHTLNIFLNQLLLAGLVSGFLLVIFYRMVGRHLLAIIGYTRTMDDQRLDRPLVLEGDPSNGPGTELDELAEAINAMRRNLHQAFEKLTRTNVDLRIEMNLREEVHQDLAESEDRLRQLAEGIEDVFWLTSPDWQSVHYISPAYEKIWGRSRESLYARPVSWMEAIAPEDLPKVNRYLAGLDPQNLTEGRFPVYRIRSEDGRERLISTKYYPVLDETGRTIRVAGVARDITRRRLAEETLQKNEALLTATQRLTRVGGWEWNVRTATVFWTEEVYRLHDLIPADSEPDPSGYIRRALACYEPPDRKRMLRAFKRCVAEGVGYDFELRLNLGGDERRWVRTTAQAIREGDEIVRVVGNIQDITADKRAQKERDRLEAQLRQAQKMEALGTLAGGIAHDFNNILSIIIGFSELALDDAEDGLTDPDQIDGILKAAYRAKDLVTQILAFSRKLEPDMRPLNVNRVIDQAEAMLERVIPRMVTIELQLADDLRPINADAGQIDQILMNLATNANDAMPDGGRLTIETGNVVLDEGSEDRQSGLPRGEYVLLTVADTGVGMDQATQDQIYDPFFTRKEVGQGTGLGLATVYGIVKNHGGGITCTSRVGRGTTFRVYLPALGRAEEAETGLPRDHGTALGGDEVILLVDDEEDIRDLGGQILTRFGYRVLTAETGEEALAIYRERGTEINLILLDISMPGMGGHRCLQELLEIDRRVRVIVVSGYSKIGPLEDTLAAGAVSYIPKPFSQTEMLATIRRVLDK